MAKKRYAVVGTGSRSGMYMKALAGPHRENGELVAFCDRNRGRMEFNNRKLAEEWGGEGNVPMYHAEDFDQMIEEQRPDVVIVTTMDSKHDEYICRAMEAGCDAITEKPMTIDEVRCRRILETQKRTGRQLQVTFNYRYSPPRSQVRELIAAGAIGEILSVDFAWLLNTRHGADYFRRWHRHRENSGSLLVHKATHHFDLVNWWIADVPQEVFCHGSLDYYTPATAERMGLSDHGERCAECPLTEQCPFHLDITSGGLRKLYYENEKYDGYFRDRCVFSPEIDIWDTMSVSVRYRRGAVLNYMLHAYSPWEGYHIAFNGTKGRLEHRACESTYISGDGTVPGELSKGNVAITLIPEFSQPQIIEPRTAKGGHGGGDQPLLDDIFDPNPPSDPLGRKADHRDGAWSILTGIAAWHSIDQSQPVKVRDLVSAEFLP